MCQGGHHHHHHDWETPRIRRDRAVRVGIGGPVGSGKTALVERLARRLKDCYSLAVITNDIYTKEDARILLNTGVLPEDRIIGVETGGCPHTAIREDASMNFEAVEELERRFPDLELIFIESGGDNLAAAFSPELADRFIYIIDVAQGEKFRARAAPASSGRIFSSSTKSISRRTSAQVCGSWRKIRSGCGEIVRTCLRTC